MRIGEPCTIPPAIGAHTYSLASALTQASTVINNLVTLLVAIASLAMLASIIIIANSVALAMLERRRELGILKAMGHTSRSVLGEVLIENGAVGILGGLLAMLLVATVTPLLGQLAFSDGSSGSASAFATPATFVLGIVPATALACMLVAASVAWRATRVRPLEVLRYE
ncbi:MAG: ABC transporter permease [Ktedonobacterales bacterium]